MNRYIEPLMIARPTLSLTNCDLNQAYVLSEMVWAVRESSKTWGRNLTADRWVPFEIEDFAENLEMPIEWMITQAEALAGKPFIRYDAKEGSRGVIQINIGRLNANQKGSEVV